MPSFWEKIHVSGQDMDLYASVPSGSGPFPAVVVIHPAGGVAEFTQGIANKLADEGYVAVCPDLFHRITCLLYTSPSPRDATLSRMPSSA